MKTSFAWAVLAIAFANPAFATVLKPLPEQKDAAVWMSRVLERYRYKQDGQPQPVGKRPLDAYLETLDVDRLIFTQSEIADFGDTRAKLDKIVDGKELEIAFEIFETYKARTGELVAYAKTVLREPIDSRDAGNSRTAGARAEWAASPAALHRLWHQRVVDDYLSLRRAGGAEKDIVRILDQRYDRNLERVNSMASTDVSQLYLTAYAQFLDPQAVYFSPLHVPKAVPENKRASLGLLVQKKDDQIVVREAVAGGPAERTGLIMAGDRILGIAQGPDQPMANAIGWLVEDAVEALRGAPGSTVVLDILPANAPIDGARKQVSVARSVVGLPVETSVAKSRVEVVTQNGVAHRIGVVVIPRFYQDFAARKAGDKDFRSVSRDVTLQLQELKQAKVEAVLLDMRNNRGGPFDEVLRLAGLFVPGTAVIQQQSNEKLAIEKAPDGAPAWDGILGVLIDQGSTSGTEAFAAAMQAHARGLVIGDTSFGSGAVQTFLALDRFAPSADVHYGDLKMTVAQLFRLDGVPLQGHGVVPDIAVPGEADIPDRPAQNNTFRLAPVRPAEFTKRGDTSSLVHALVQRHNARTSSGAGHQPSPNMRQVQMDEALHILSDEVEVLRAQPAIAKQAGLASALIQGAP